jgi:hypothetical protein
VSVKRERVKLAGREVQRCPGKSVKNHRVYAALRRQGYAKGKSARIANAFANGTLNRRRGRRR